MVDQRNAEGEALAAARDYGRDALESAKGRLADGADRAAGAAERMAEHLEDESGENAVSDLGRNLAGMIRQLAGGTRDHDIEMIANELGQLARRKPGVFLAGSVALGFGLARFLKARPAASRGDNAPGGNARERPFDEEDALDMSENAQHRASAESGDWASDGEETRSSRESETNTGVNAS